MPDAPVGTVSGVWFAAVLLGGEAVSISFSQLAGLLAALCIALVGIRTIMWERELSCRLVRRFRARLRSGKIVNPDATQALSVAMAFSRGFFLCAAAVGVLAAAPPVLADAGSIADRDYRLVIIVVQGLSIGVLFPVFVRRAKGRLPAFAGGIALALLIRNLAG